MEKMRIALEEVKLKVEETDCNQVEANTMSSELSDCELPPEYLIVLIGSVRRDPRNAVACCQQSAD